MAWASAGCKSQGQRSAPPLHAMPRTAQRRASSHRSPQQWGPNSSPAAGARAERVQSTAPCQAAPLPAFQCGSLHRCAPHRGPYGAPHPTSQPTVVRWADVHHAASQSVAAHRIAAPRTAPLHTHHLMTPYTVHAVHPDGTPTTIALMARSIADALLVAAELFTDCTPVRAVREGEW